MYDQCRLEIISETNTKRDEDFQDHVEKNCSSLIKKIANILDKTHTFTLTFIGEEKEKSKRVEC